MLLRAAWLVVVGMECGVGYWSLAWSSDGIFCRRFDVQPFSRWVLIAVIVNESVSLAFDQTSSCRCGKTDHTSACCMTAR